MENPLPSFRVLDVFEDVVEIASFFKHPVLLLCDNGNKPYEIVTYSPHLVPGDLVAVHDWGTEISESSIPEHFHMIHLPWSVSMTRFFLVT